MQDSVQVVGKAGPAFFPRFQGLKPMLEDTVLKPKCNLKLNLQLDFLKTPQS